jgi:hypothetical protein
MCFWTFGGFKTVTFKKFRHFNFHMFSPLIYSIRGKCHHFLVSFPCLLLFYFLWVLSNKCLFFLLNYPIFAYQFIWFICWYPKFVLKFVIITWFSAKKVCINTCYFNICIPFTSNTSHLHSSSFIYMKQSWW